LHQEQFYALIGAALKKKLSQIERNVDVYKENQRDSMEREKEREVLDL
jgi:hypothetical protein